MPRKESLQNLRATLVRRRDALRKALAGDLSLLSELHQQKTGDALDAAADTVQDELNSQLVEVESKELVAIEEAIAKFQQGTYGDCEDCGKPIPLNRLRAIPYASDCIECRRKAENDVDGASPAVPWNRIFDMTEADTIEG
ncbi:TraR/DksA family transcriptional regulator [Allorhodopirellula heiligendammensis]|uniref:General stress protein 16O n=1 Tax=Allorhodopirellula heiligendammensis TaxID=2714739 RepID=A0A5C6BWI0_9BACT|nr:TraR/DksA family transcriptional regulator [Allorhodopirellula heiligendammensis]TWU16613.1 General stress protein 16O [Allorhodopirellula heiligendammensis]|tara:strand:- start:175 stop:597 length:423 start_codon:yes stop_codon:yes gene_type:complete